MQKQSEIEAKQRAIEDNLTKLGITISPVVKPTATPATKQPAPSVKSKS